MTKLTLIRELHPIVTSMAFLMSVNLKDPTATVMAFLTFAKKIATRTVFQTTAKVFQTATPMERRMSASPSRTATRMVCPMSVTPILMGTAFPMLATKTSMEMGCPTSAMLTPKKGPLIRMLFTGIRMKEEMHSGTFKYHKDQTGTTTKSNL